MAFATAAGWAWGSLVAGVSAWTWVRIRRRGAGLGPAVALVAAAMTVPVVPSPDLPIRVERVRYAGPDLLSDVAVERVPVADSTRAAGLSRVRRLRVVQGGTLLEEIRRVGVRLPWLWAAVVLAVGAWSRTRFRIVAALLLAAVSAGCAGDERRGVAELRLEEVLEMRRTGEVEGVEEVFLAGAVYEDVAAQAEYQGVPEIADYLGWVHRWASGIFMQVIRVHAGDDVASAEWVLDAIQTAPLTGLVDSVTHRRFQLRGITVVEVERGAVVRAVDYVDLVPLLLDLGGEIRTPGGVVLRRTFPDRPDGG